MKLEDLKGIISKGVFIYNDFEILEYDKLTIDELIKKGYGSEEVKEIKSYKNVINIIVV